MKTEGTDGVTKAVEVALVLVSAPSPLTGGKYETIVRETRQGVVKVLTRVKIRGRNAGMAGAQVEAPDSL